MSRQKKSWAESASHAHSPFRVVEPNGQEVEWVNRYLDQERVRGVADSTPSVEAIGRPIGKRGLIDVEHHRRLHRRLCPLLQPRAGCSQNFRNLLVRNDRRGCTRRPAVEPRRDLGRSPPEAAQRARSRRPIAGRWRRPAQRRLPTHRSFGAVNPGDPLVQLLSAFSLASSLSVESSLVHIIATHHCH